MLQECFFKVLVSSLSTPGEFSTACKLPLDLAAYASPEHSEDHISLQVSFATKQSGKGQPFGQLRLQFSSHLPTVSPQIRAFPQRSRLTSGAPLLILHRVCELFYQRQVPSPPVNLLTTMWLLV